MDRQQLDTLKRKIIAAVANENGVVLSKDDPILMTLLMNHLLLDESISSIDHQIAKFNLTSEHVNDLLMQYQAGFSESLSKAGQSVIERSSAIIADEIKRFSIIVDELKKEQKALNNLQKKQNSVIKSERKQLLVIAAGVAFIAAMIGGIIARII